MVKKGDFTVCLLVSILINALLIFIISNSAKHKDNKKIIEVEFLSPSLPEEPEPEPEQEPEPEPEQEPEPEPEQEPEPEPEQEPEPEPEQEPKPELPPPEKGKVFTVPVEEKDSEPEHEEDSVSPKKKEEDKTVKEAKTQEEIAYEAQKFKYEAYAKQVHQKLRRYLPWLKKTYGSGRAIVKFAVHRDGTTSHVSLLESSGNKDFDEEVMKLVGEETFDKLPIDYEKNILVTAFEFRIGMNN
jgi:TonB family protein